MHLNYNVNILNDKHDCKTELSHVKLRATTARLALMKFLEESSKPVDIQMMTEYLCKSNIKTNQATVFRIINIFTQKGLTRKMQLNEGKFRYELATNAEHHHLICEECGRIEDISDCHIANLEKEIAYKKDFLVTSHSLEFFGFCKNCAKNKFIGNK